MALDGVEFGFFSGNGGGGYEGGGDGFVGENGEDIVFYFGVSARDDILLPGILAVDAIEAKHAGAEFGEEGCAEMEDSDEAIKCGYLSGRYGCFEHDGFGGHNAGFEGGRHMTESLREVGKDAHFSGFW